MSKRNLVFIIILIASFFIRIQRLDFPLSDIFWWGDSTRDYLVANHIIKYQEFPRLGPYNLLYESGVRNSPLYFYVLALLLIPFNHPVTLTFFNIVFQIAVLILIYAVVRKIFNSQIALSALVLFSFSSGVIEQSDYIWQPYLMQPVALLGLYLLIKAHFDKSYKFFIASLITFCLSTAIHLSALIWLPIFLFTGIILLKDRPIKYFLGTIAAIFTSLGFLYTSTIPFLTFNNLSPPLIVNNIGSYFNNLALNLTEVFGMLNINFWFLFVFMALSLVAYISGTVRNKWLILTILMFFMPIILASLVNKIRPNYLILSLVPFVVWITVFIHLSCQRLGKMLILSFIFIIFSDNLNFIRENSPLENLKYIENITDKILVELNSNRDSFRVKSYAFENNFFEYPALDTMLLVPLEDKLKQKLTRVSDESPYNHIQINKGDYIFVSCYIFNVKKMQTSCRDKFEKKGDYKLLKTVYLDKNLEIYLYVSKPTPGVDQLET